MRKLLLAAVAVGALTGASAVAQNATPTNPDTESAATADKMNSSTTQGGAAMGANPNAATSDKALTQDVPKNGPSFIQVQNTDMLSSNVVGLEVYNGQNNNIGKIQDIAFNTSRQMTGYVLSIGGFLGLGTHYVAVDPNAVMVQYDANNKTWRATMNVTKEELKSAPEFKYSGQWTASRS